MPMNTDGLAAISKLDKWYRDHCNGTWEHLLGIKIETTDNPGWLVTFKELKLNQLALADVIGDLLRNYGAQVATDGIMVRVFATSLQNCLIAAALLIDLPE